mmetsp:Transcript_10279/g.24617  ORF Transcript_10279/g.24617 Transcript_10279/m.24617 type:complete len:83 (-) Transcript_10279:4601-4849(-)
MQPIAPHTIASNAREYSNTPAHISAVQTANQSSIVLISLLLAPFTSVTLASMSTPNMAANGQQPPQAVGALPLALSKLRAVL